MPQRLTAFLFLISALFLTPALAAEDATRATPAPAGANWWWDDAWWEQGQIPAPTNHLVGPLGAGAVLVSFSAA